ncbi:NF038129 family PEP-CTERM protein [Massilia sp.]|uniref:NF038129 family PEP-CTERM protein n=1 Tax=Massilia sp. TaxID=1882437 RepID=UPI00352D9027
MQIRFKQLVSALVLMLAAGTGAASAETIHVAIDTSTFGAATGYVDMQLSASSGVPLATALVSNMVGFDSTAFIDSWGVTPVAGGYLFRNDTSNDLFHAVDFGGMLSFDLTFDGAPDPLTSYVSHFVVSAFDDAFAPLGHTDPFTGALADFTWTPALNVQGHGTIGGTLSDPAVTAVPEPAGMLLAAIGLASLALARRRRA